MTPLVSADVVVICGSTRFRDEIAVANRDLTLAGHIVLAPGVFTHTGDLITGWQKRQLDALHLAKIDRADWVYVVNPGGYVDESSAARSATPARPASRSATSSRCRST